MRSWGTLWVIIMGVLGGADPASAQYFLNPDSEIDPSIFRIDEKAFLGVKFDPNLPLIDPDGKNFKLGSLLGKPLIVVLSYYQCDGSCSVINRQLKSMLTDVKRVQIGPDYHILTVSFDKSDTLKTVTNFRTELELPPAWLGGWTFTLPGDQESLRRLTDSIGYKYFWSPRDKTFFHPTVYAVLSGEGRVVRFLYSTATVARDLELALIDAQTGQVSTPKDYYNLAVGLCYSYNYKDGRYTINIPLFIGVGAFVFGILVLTFSVVGYRWRKRKERAE